MLEIQKTVDESGTTGTDNTIIKIKDLWHAYRSKKQQIISLKGVDLDIQEGELLSDVVETFTHFELPCFLEAHTMPNHTGKVFNFIKLYDSFQDNLYHSDRLVSQNLFPLRLPEKMAIFYSRK